MSDVPACFISSVCLGQPRSQGLSYGGPEGSHMQIKNVAANSKFNLQIKNVAAN